MKEQIKEGLGFGLTSGVITTLGLMIGLAFGTNSKLVVITGLITIAIADAFSDALGMHISQESRIALNSKKIWTTTIITFLSKFFLALSFIIPVLLFSLRIAIIFNIFYGLLILIFLSIYIAKSRKESVIKATLEHVIIAMIVIILSYVVGEIISLF